MAEDDVPFKRTNVFRGVRRHEPVSYAEHTTSSSPPPPIPQPRIIALSSSPSEASSPINVRQTNISSDSGYVSSDSEDTPVKRRQRRDETPLAQKCRESSIISLDSSPLQSAQRAHRVKKPKAERTESVLKKLQKFADKKKLCHPEQRLKTCMKRRKDFANSPRPESSTVSRVRKGLRSAKNAQGEQKKKNVKRLRKHL